MRIGAAALALLGSSLLALAACQLVAGTESREANPFPTACTFPNVKGAPQVRFADFVPTADVVDVCIRSAGGSWGEPIILGGGYDCTNSKKGYFGSSGLPTSKPATPNAAGIDYSQVTVPFSAPGPAVDVKVVVAGQNCNAPALTETDGLKLNTKAVTTLLRIGGAPGSGVPQKIEALGEVVTANPTGIDLRFAHVMPGVGQLDVGLGPSGVQALPTTVETPLLMAPLSFGQVPPAGENTFEGKPVTDDGYMEVLQGTFNIVAGVHGTTPEKAVLLEYLTPQNGSQYTLYMAGVPRNNTFPQRGFLCDEVTPPPSGQNPLLANCVGTGLSGISVDVFTASLYGPNSPDFTDRQHAMESTPNSGMNPVFSRDSDIMCFSELDFRTDIQSLIAGGGPADSGTPGRFPYSYWVQTNVTTPPNPPDMPPTLSSPPCVNTTDAGAALAGDVAAAFQCMEKNCSTVPNSASGTLPGSTDCLSKECPAQFSALLLSGEFNACFDCIIDYVASDQPYNIAQSACTGLQQQPFGFDGQLSNLILSRYPLLDSKVYILPSSQYRQGVLYSRVQLEDQQVDFYCGFFTSTLVAQDLPYVGPYGGDADPNSSQQGGAYANEQGLQANRLVDWVHSVSGGANLPPCTADQVDAGGASTCAVPAIIVGDWRASQAAEAGAPMGMYAPPVDLVPNTLVTLENAFTAVAAPGWPPQCTYCPQSQNVLNSGSSVGYFMNQPFLYAWGGSPQTAVQEEQLIYTQPVVQPGANSGIDASLVPLSQYFGVNIQIIRPQ
jgi:hypothetical protein